MANASCLLQTMRRELELGIFTRKTLTVRDRLILWGVAFR